MIGLSFFKTADGVTHVTFPKDSTVHDYIVEWYVPETINTSGGSFVQNKLIVRTKYQNAIYNKAMYDIGGKMKPGTYTVMVWTYNYDVPLLSPIAFPWWNVMPSMAMDNESITFTV